MELESIYNENYNKIASRLAGEMIMKLDGVKTEIALQAMCMFMKNAYENMKVSNDGKLCTYEEFVECIYTLSKAFEVKESNDG